MEFSIRDFSLSVKKLRNAYRQGSRQYFRLQLCRFMAASRVPVTQGLPAFGRYNVPNFERFCRPFLRFQMEKRVETLTGAQDRVQGLICDNAELISRKGELKQIWSLKSKREKFEKLYFCLY